MYVGLYKCNESQSWSLNPLWVTAGLYVKLCGMLALNYQNMISGICQLSSKSKFSLICAHKKSHLVAHFPLTGLTFLQIFLPRGRRYRPPRGGREYEHPSLWFPKICKEGNTKWISLHAAPLSTPFPDSVLSLAQSLPWLHNSNLRTRPAGRNAASITINSLIFQTKISRITGRGQSPSPHPQSTVEHQSHTVLLEERRHTM